MSLNRFRTKIKKKVGKDKNTSESNLIKPAVVTTGTNSGSSSGLLGLLPPKESKRKALSVSSPPDVSSPVHMARKISLSTDSPSHMKQTPTSPLVTAKLSGLVSLTPQDTNTVTNGSTSVSSRSSTPVLALPKVSIANAGEDQHRQGIIDITVNVQSFLAAISKLKKAMEESDSQKDEEASAHSPGSPSYSITSIPECPDVIISHVTNLIQVVQTCLNEHSSMQSTAIKDAAKELLNTYRDCEHTSPATCADCNGAIEALIDAFTNSVSEYLTGESAEQDPAYVPASNKEPAASGGSIKKGLERAGLKGFSKSHDNLSSKFTSYIDLSQQFSEPITDDIDQALFSIEDSTEVAARYIKMRVKYHKEIAAYLTKRAQIEAGYMKQMSNLGSKTLRALQEMGHPLPMMDVFRKSIEGDMRYATNANTTLNQQVTSKFIDPLEHKINDCERRRKELNSTWRNEKKKLIEAKTAMKNAMSKYRFLGEDLSRVKNLLAMDPYGKQAEKRKKELSDIETRWQETEQAYKNAVAECNDCQYQVHIAAQRSILCAYRRMVIDLDIQLQSGLDTYYTLQQNFFTALPEPMAKHLEDVRDYNIGSEFMDYVHQHPKQREEPEDYLFEEFDPEAEETTENYMATEVVGGGARIPNSASSDSSTFLNHGAEDGPDRAPSPNPFQDPPFHRNAMAVATDSKQPPSTSSPRAAKRSRPHSEMFEGDSVKNSLMRRNSDQTRSTKETLTPPTATPQQPVAQGTVPYSKMALTHTFKKLRGPARCRECDTYVYFHGQECEICGLACHKKCLETLAIRCGNKRLARKMNTFGVDFHKHLKATKRYIPIIVTKCIEEIDERALDTRGLYRISSAKTKLEHLCQLFESGADRVDLSDRPSHLIGSCLKLYFRQLPEPLLTFGLYHEFVTFARECSYILPCNLETVTGEKRETALEMLERLNGLLQKLPYENYITLAKLLYHLNKVSHPDHVKHNFMPPSNLGIVFGPNLLRQREMVASLALLADMTAQAKAIEIMISHVNELFHMTEDKLKEVEHEYDDNSDFTKEVNVDEPTESIKSPQLELEDVTTVGSRTPYNTPPERRRENVFELGEVLEVLQSVGRRNSEKSLLKPPHPRLGDVRDHHVSTSLPSFPPTTSSFLPTCVGSEDSTLTTLSKFLHSSSVPSNPLEKMLTPVEEHEPNPFSDDDEDIEDTTIICSTSNKIDGMCENTSRPCSSMSNPGGVTWIVDSEVSSTKDNLSILSGGDGERQGKVTILGDGGNVRKESSQSSDEDSHLFSASVRTLLSSGGGGGGEGPTSPADSEPPISKRISDTFTDSSSSPRFHPYQKRNSLRDTYSGSQCSSPLSPTSRATISSQSSYSEMMGEDGEVKLRKYSVSDKYARYEAYRASLAAVESQSEEKDSPIGFSQSSTQDSSATLTEEMMLSAAEDERGSGKQTSPTKSEEGVECQPSPSHESGCGVNNRKLLDIKDSLKHCDSGIDDTPEANKSFKDGVRRLSMPPSGDDCSVTDAKPLSYTSAFASRESGLADSPDPEMLIDEAMLQKAHRLQPHDATKEVIMTDNASEVEIFVPLCEDDSQMTEDGSEGGGRRIRARSEKLSSSYSIERPNVVPRSLEHPSFSRYARTPIRDSRVLRAADVPLQAGSGLRYRSVSMDKISSAAFETDSKDKSPAESRAYSMSSSKSAMLSPFFSPVHHPAAAAQNQIKNIHHPNQRFCVNKDTPPSTPTTPSSTTSHSNLHDDTNTSTSSPFGSPSTTARNKKTKGIRERLKPALRVLKINSGSTPPSEILQDPPQEVDEQDVHTEGSESPLDSSPDSSPKLSTPSCASVGQTRRVRMMSPEAVATHHMLSSSHSLRRSQSSEDILESGALQRKGAEGQTKIGSLVVVPEPKYKLRGKFFDKLKGRRKGSREGSPAVLTKGHHSVSADGIFALNAEGGSKSPKYKKRHRTPHFV